MEILGKLFGSPAKIKIMRLFLLNPNDIFSSKNISKRAKISSSSVRSELNSLLKIGFIKRIKKGFSFDSLFSYHKPLRDLLIGTDFISKDDLLTRFKSVGRLKLLIASGIFIRSIESRVDLLLVGDNLKRNKIDKAIKTLESEIGKELVYAIFSVSEYKYRLSMYDKLICDIIDFPHQVLLDKEKLSTHIIKKSV